MTQTEKNQKNTSVSSSAIDYAAAEILAIQGNHYIRFAENQPILRLYKLYYSMYWYLLELIADILLLLLPLFERPAFIQTPSWVPLIIELIALSMLLASFILSMHLQNKRKLFREAAYPYIFIIIFILTIVDMIIYYTLLYKNHYYVRWSRPLRVLFPFALQAGQHIRRVVRNILRTLPNIGNVMFLFLLSLLTFTLIGIGIFKSNNNLRYPDGSHYFRNYGDGIWDLYVLTTTANNPDVMMPAYNSNMLYVVFFLGYLIVNLYLFMNLLLAVIFSNYKQHLQDEQQVSRQRQLDSLLIIFERLTSNTANHRLSYETYERLMHAIRDTISRDIIEAYWNTLGVKNKGDGLDLKQFNELLLNLNFDLKQRNDDQKLLQRICPTIYNSKPSRVLIDFINTTLFRIVINLLIIGNTICLAVGYNTLEWFFLGAFVVEALLKMYAIGVVEYFKHRWNVFDFVIIFVSVVYSLVTTFVPAFSLDQSIVDGILVIRVLRLVKLVGNVERFKVIFGTFSKVIPRLITYLRVMFMTYYVFSMIGMELFQDKFNYVKEDNNTLSYCNNTKLNGSEFARAKYCRNNFNDYLSSLILLFELTVVNQWHILASGFVLVTSKAARLFFLAFHLCAVIVVLNIFTAFIIDSFLNQYSLSTSQQFPWTQQENVITERLTEQGYRVIRRYDDKEKAKDKNKKFNIKTSIQSMIQPPIYRRMTVTLHSSHENERCLLLRWLGNSDIDPDSFLKLTNETT